MQFDLSVWDFEFLRPIKNLLIFIGTYIIDKLIYVLLLIVTLFIFYLISRYIEKGELLLKSVIKKTRAYLHNKKTKAIVDRFSDCESKEKKIMRDIKLHINMMQIPEKKYVAIQFLLQYPSALGFKAILDVAIQLNDQEIRKTLICQLCESIKTNDWYLVY